VRLGPSLYIHDLELLIDTPEEIGVELNRSGITRVRTVLYTHWHPDHTAGIRVFEGNYHLGSLLDPRRPPRQTRVILPDRVARTFERHHALSDKLAYLEQYGLVRVDEVPLGEPVAVGAPASMETPGPAQAPGSRPAGWQITPVPLAEEFAVAYLLEGERRVFICMDESFEFDPNGLGQLDLAVLPSGYFSHHPYTGERIIAENHPVLHREIAYEQTLDLIRKMDVARVVLVHLNHGFHLTHTEFERLAAELEEDNTLPPLEFGYDTMRIEV
jgi:phosphoribosyl 1,2-cyclic phosphate phosphodiesterase